MTPFHLYEFSVLDHSYENKHVSLENNVVSVTRHPRLCHP